MLRTDCQDVYNADIAYEGCVVLVALNAVMN